MKIDHLTFGQLFKLAHSTNLMRVTRAYHGALEKCWYGSAFTMDRHFTVTDAETEFPEVARSYRPVLAFLTGPELKLALRFSADNTRVPYMPGDALELCRPRTYPHAQLVVSYCLNSLAISYYANGAVWVKTTPLGIEILRHRSGPTCLWLARECQFFSWKLADILWWLHLARPVKPGDRLNPCTSPCNTPDVAELAESLIYRYLTPA